MKVKNRKQTKDKTVTKLVWRAGWICSQSYIKTENRMFVCPIFYFSASIKKTKWRKGVCICTIWDLDYLSLIDHYGIMIKRKSYE